VITALGLLLSPASLARAYEDQLSFGVGAGYAYGTQQGASDHGAYFQLEASLGVSPTWSVRGVLAYAAHPATPRWSQGLLGVEALYLVDVLELVPYAGIGIDALAGFTPSDTRFDVGAHPVLGIDWLLGRSFLLGFSARPIFVLSGLERGPLYLVLSLTATWLWDL